MDNEEYLLVSDSDEISPQLDSKKMSPDELIHIVENDLFGKHLTVLENYITDSQLLNFLNSMKSKLESYTSLFNQIKDMHWSGKFKVVHGQVILIHANELPDKTSPEEYIRQKWDIPSTFQLVQIKNCFIRGITTEVQSLIKGSSEVILEKENIPLHMHHSSITENSKIKSISLGTSTSNKTNNIPYDILYDDSFSTGLDRNELDGTFTNFEVNPFGESVISHNNIPKYEEYYAFEVISNEAQT